MAFFQQTHDDDGFITVSSRKREIKTCEHCGERSNPGYKPRCHCKEIIGYYGNLTCSSCKIHYNVCMTIDKYIESSIVKGDKEYAFMNYPSYFNKTMPEPCSACSPLYKKEHTELKYTFDKWREWYIDTYGYPEEYIRHQLEDYYDDEPCRSSSGMCPCCGDCP